MLALYARPLICDGLPPVVVGRYRRPMTVVQLRPRALTRDTLARLVSAYVETGDLALAASAAGMPLEAANAALQGPGVRSMIQRAVRHHIDAVAVPRALAVTVALLGSASEKVRGDAARSILDRGGYAAPPADAMRERGLAELSADELRALIGELQSELADKAQPVAEATDWLD